MSECVYRPSVSVSIPVLLITSMWKIESIGLMKDPLSVTVTCILQVMDLLCRGEKYLVPKKNDLTVPSPKEYGMKSREFSFST